MTHLNNCTLLKITYALELQILFFQTIVQCLILNMETISLYLKIR